jgi:O-antigen ligase
VRWGSLLCLASLVLSYRRSFWIAAVIGIVLVVVIASGPVGRRLMVPGILILAAGIYLAISGGLVTESQSPVVQRATSLAPSKVSANADDRYRLDERRNVIAQIKQDPITGLGFEVPWAQRYALSEQHLGGQDYVHMSILWFWLKLGLLGVIAYLWLCATAVWTGVRVWRRHPDRLVRVAALAAAAGTVGLMVAELTASFTGTDLRLTVVFAALCGFLAAARRGLPAREDAVLPR